MSVTNATMKLMISDQAQTQLQNQRRDGSVVRVTERPAESGNMPNSPLCWKPIARLVGKSNGEAVVPSGQAPTMGCGALEQGNALFIVCHDCLVP